MSKWLFYKWIDRWKYFQPKSDKSEILQGLDIK